MSYPASRGMNNNFSEGSTDGKYKKVINNRGGVTDNAGESNLADLADSFYGTGPEKQVKVTPDGLLHATPEFVRRISS